ncbi:ATP-binding protein [candidate division KSB1 bacterium]|nr:ATP-binding protein [candidate division KSB1 bacterium]
MVFKQFRIVCTVRVIALSLTMLLFFYLFFKTSLFALILLLGFATLYQIYTLIRYVEKTNIYLSRFLEAIKYEDYSQSFASVGYGKSFIDLKSAFADVLGKFKQTRAEKEEQYRYLQTVVKHIGIGLISFRQDGEVELINTAAKRILKIPHLKNIRALESFSPKLVKALLNTKPGDKSLIKIEKHGDLLQLAIYATEFKLREQQYTLVSIQNIQYELEEKEMEAWQNLIRVLTHEIMNSVTPIGSLASTMQGLLNDIRIPEFEKKSEQEDMLTDARSAAHTIEKRSRGLLDFVESYRKLTRLPRPDFQIVRVSDLFNRVDQLMADQLKENSIHWKTMIDPDSLEITADPSMIEQVLINLIVNAIQAVANEENRKIHIIGLMDSRGRPIIQITDNGGGIEGEVQEKIFIPFFTTKKGGSGIGLSLSRQIMRLHRGSISVQSEPGHETTFTLRF